MWYFNVVCLHSASFNFFCMSVLYCIIFIVVYLSYYRYILISFFFFFYMCHFKELSQTRSASFIHHLVMTKWKPKKRFYTLQVISVCRVEEVSCCLSLTAMKGKNTKVWRDPDPHDVNKMWNPDKVYQDTGPTRPRAVLCCVCLLARGTAVRSQSVWSVTQSHCCLKALQVMWLNRGYHESCFSDRPLRHKLQTFRLNHRISAQNLIIIVLYIYFFFYVHLSIW